MLRRKIAYWKHSINITIIRNYPLPQTHICFNVALPRKAGRKTELVQNNRVNVM